MLASYLRRFLPLSLPLVFLLGGPLAAQDDWGEEDTLCAGVLDQSVEELAETLAQVPSKYSTTYVVVYADQVEGEIDSVVSPPLKSVEVAVYEGSPAIDIAERAGLTVKLYPFEPGKVVDQVLAGNVAAAVVWGPLAGLGALELDFDYALSFVTTGGPSPPPAVLQSTTVATGEPGECAVEIGGILEGYGVIPAEKLVPLDIREFLHLPPPARDLAAARAAAPLYAEHCAKCHGSEGVASTDALAPVDLLVSVRRFSFPGFLYIALNGRSQNGMPGFRGSLSEDDVTQIYRYVRGRSQGELAATGAVP